MTNLELFLKNEGLVKPKIDDLVSYFSKVGEDEFLFPFSLSAKQSISIDVASKALLLLSAEGIFDIYTVPEFEESLLRDYTKKGLYDDASKFEVQHPIDFEPVDPSLLKLVTAYKRRVSS